MAAPALCSAPERLRVLRTAAGTLRLAAVQEWEDLAAERDEVPPVDEADLVLVDEDVGFFAGLGVHLPTARAGCEPEMSHPAQRIAP
jgi:hypothetical protein